MKRFFRRLQFLRRRTALDRELAEELEFHRAMKQQENEAAGLSPSDAREVAQRQMGNLTQAKESSRDTWSFLWLEQLWQDLSVALRSLRRDRGFTTVAILSLALGIGANTAIFTALNTVLLRPLPYAQPQQLFEVAEPIHGHFDRIMDPEFEAWRNDNRVFSDLAAWNGAELDFSGSGSPERVMGADITQNFLPTLRVTPTLGRNFSTKEDLPDGPRVAILTDHFWRQHFSANPAVLGTQIKLNGDAYTAIGVLPASFRFPGNIVPELLMPTQLPQNANWGARTIRGLNVLGRLRPGITPDRTQADLRLISKHQEHAMPAWVHHVRRSTLPLQLTPLRRYLAGDSRRILVVLFAAVLILLGIACANVTNLQLSRAAARHSELAVRSALGAGRNRLIRFLLTESFAISLSGGFCGIVLTWILLHLLSTTQALHDITAVHLSVDPNVLLFTLAVSISAGLICGLLPALVASRPVLYTAIKGTDAPLFGLGIRSRGFFVVCEVALTLVLLVGAFLLLRSLQQVLATNPGFQPENTLTFQTNFGNASHRNPLVLLRSAQSEWEHIAALPGVRSVGASSSLLLTGDHGTASIAIDGQSNPPPGLRPTAPLIAVTPSYFETLHIPVLAGRAFSKTDSSHSLLVGIVNVSFVRRFFGNADPLGRRILHGAPSNPLVTVVGVVADTHDTGLAAAPDSELYLPYLQNPDLLQGTIGIALRTTLPPVTLLPAIRKVIAKADPTQPIFDIATMEHRLSESTSSRRTQTALLTTFALIALFLATIGVYGILSYAVRQTTREIGIRMALGAQKATVLRGVIRRGFFLALAGIAIGLTVSVATVRYLTSFLFHVKPLDWISFTLSAVLLLVLALLASYIPARRAADVDPMTALRYE